MLLSSLPAKPVSCVYHCVGLLVHVVHYEGSSCWQKPVIEQLKFRHAEWTGCSCKDSLYVSTVCCAVQIGQLFKIFQVLGTPCESTWQGVEGMPCWQAQFPQWHACDLAEVRMATGPVLPYRA